MTAWRPLRGLLVAQFLGAFNDNAWKILVTLLALRAIVPHPVDAGQRAGPAAGPALEAAAQARTTLAFVVFTLPLVLFSLPAGILADRVSKRRAILAMKGVEVLLMAGGTLALLAAMHGWVAPLVVLGLMGAQSALLSPAKYGILPEILPHERISAGDALLESWTFLAIIAGTASGGCCSPRLRNEPGSRGSFSRGWRPPASSPRAASRGSGRPGARVAWRRPLRPPGAPCGPTESCASRSRGRSSTGP